MECNNFRIQLARAREMGLNKGGKVVTQQELAELLGIKRELVAYWENGTREPKAEQIIQIAKALGVTSDYLLGLTDIPVHDPGKRSAQKYVGLTDATLSFLHQYKDDVGGLEWKMIRMVEKLLQKPRLLSALCVVDDKVGSIMSDMAADPARFFVQFAYDSQNGDKCYGEGFPDDVKRDIVLQDWEDQLEVAVFRVSKAAVEFADSVLGVQALHEAVSLKRKAIKQNLMVSIVDEQEG